MIIFGIICILGEINVIIILRGLGPLKLTGTRLIVTVLFSVSLVLYTDLWPDSYSTKMAFLLSYPLTCGLIVTVLFSVSLV